MALDLSSSYVSGCMHHHQGCGLHLLMRGIWSGGAVIILFLYVIDFIESSACVWPFLYFQNISCSKLHENRPSNGFTTATTGAIMKLINYLATTGVLTERKTLKHWKRECAALERGNFTDAWENVEFHCQGMGINAVNNFALIWIGTILPWSLKSILGLNNQTHNNWQP
jgi:hypothetical protein